MRFGCQTPEDVSYEVLDQYTDGRDVGEQYLGPDTDARMDVVRQVAKEVGATLSQVVLAWMAQGSPAMIPLVAALSS